ncbi:MAG: ATP-dependent helicase HepA [Syntrophorhabdus sp. PtaU1.Bin002]|nr:MAG: ATP-dependent helicase HepA [Syntrophorhabdus sp. PtaU1.Bin002]
MGALFNEPMRVETVSAQGADHWVVGLVGTQSEKFRKATLTSADLDTLTIIQPGFTYDGDGNLLRLGLQAYSLGIAYEFDPYLGLSISRVDPLPHQLEAVYDYLLKLARVKFLLADDAGAGKTIMAGLLIRELKLRGLAVNSNQFTVKASRSSVWVENHRGFVRGSADVRLDINF